MKDTRNRQRALNRKSRIEANKAKLGAILPAKSLYEMAAKERQKRTSASVSENLHEQKGRASDKALEEACHCFNRKESHTRTMTSPGFIGCVYCGEDGDSLIDGETGIFCLNCDRYCWLDTESGGLVRADHDDDLIEWDAPMDIDYSLIGKGHPGLEKPLGIKPRWRRKERS